MASNSWLQVHLTRVNVNAVQNVISYKLAMYAMNNYLLLCLPFIIAMLMSPQVSVIL